MVIKIVYFLLEISTNNYHFVNITAQLLRSGGVTVGRGTK